MCRSTRRGISLLVVLLVIYGGLLNLSAASSRARSNSIDSDLRVQHLDLLIGRIALTGDAAWQPPAPHFVEAGADGLTYATEQFKGGTLLIMVLDSDPSLRQRQTIPQATSDWLRLAAKIHKRFGPRSLNVITLTTGNRSYAVKLSREIDDTIPILYDVGAGFMRAWRISPVQTPRAFLVDKRSRIVEGYAPWAVDRTPEMQALAMSNLQPSKYLQPPLPAPKRPDSSMARLLSSKALDFLGLGGLVSPEASSSPADGAPSGKESVDFGGGFMPNVTPGGGMPSGASHASQQSGESARAVALDNRPLPPWVPTEAELVETIEGLYLEFAAPELLLRETRRLYPDAEHITLAPVYQIGTGLFRVKDAKGLFLGYLRAVHQEIQCPLCHDPHALVAVRAENTLDMLLLDVVQSWGRVRDTEHFIQQVSRLQRDRPFSLSFTQHRANEDRLLEGMDMLDGISGATSTSHALLNALQQTVRAVLRVEHPNDTFIQAKHAAHRPF